MRNLLPLLLLAACAGEVESPESENPTDAGTAADVCCDAGADPDATLPGLDAGAPEVDAAVLPGPDGQVGAPDAGSPDAEVPQDQVLAGGDAAGRWCGHITLQGTVTVPAGQTLAVCAGSEVEAVGGATALVVLGTLEVQGTAELPVRFGGDGWRGLRVGGIFNGQHFELTGAAQGIEGGPESSIFARHALITDCDQALVLANGGRFDNSTLRRGNALQISGGVLRMTDTLVTLEHDTRSPDCTNFDGGGAVLDHVRFTGCHCPLHINAAPEGVVVTNSIFDGAANPVMIAQTEADLRGNHFEGTDAHLLDIGGGFRADITGSYFGGGAPRLSSRNQAQFVGADQFSATPIPGVGPR